MSQGAGSSSGSRRSRSESAEPSIRRVMPRRSIEIEEEETPEAASIVTEGEGSRARWPHGPRLGAKFAEGWTGSDLVLVPERHISRRLLQGEPIGHMQTFSGFTSVFKAYHKSLSVESKAMLEGCAFGPLIKDWMAIAGAKTTANLVVIRAFIDRFWDTTNTFHMPGYEAGMTYSEFGIISGLPCGDVPMGWDFDPPTLRDDRVVALIGGGLKYPGFDKPKKKAPFIVKTCYIFDFFEGLGVFPPEDNTHEANARLWLWWFLGATYFGDKGERVVTSTLHYLSDFGRMGDYDWVAPALGLTIKYCRDAVRPDVMDKGSAPSLVYPGIIMEAWIFSHFPSLLPPGFESPFAYPAVRAWACCDRSDWGWTYEDVQRRLNELTSDQFIPRPFAEYRRLPPAVATRMLPRDAARLYLGTPFDSFWYLGERLARQAGYPRFVVPFDPPACLFVQTSDPEVRRTVYQEGGTRALLHEGADYARFARTRLAPGWLQAYDPYMECQPPDFPTFVEYGEWERRLELPRVTTVTTDSGMDSWGSKIRKVAGNIHKKLWRTANRWRDLAAMQATELCECQQEKAALKLEIKELRRHYQGP